MTSTAVLGRRAIVVGAGVAGLFTARVLSEVFEEVVLVDRDDIPAAPGPRPGVPQGRHLHALLAGGLDVAEELFPGFAGDLEACGSARGVNGVDVVCYRPEGKSYSMVAHQPEPIPGDVGYIQTRGLLEHCLRSRVQALPGVVVRYGTAVRDPLMDDGRVVGAVLDGQPLTADLVVDAAGRASRTDRWLKELGAEPPPESVVNVDLCYSSALFRSSNRGALEGLGFFLFPPAEGDYLQRGGVLMTVEDGMWMVTIAGRYGDHPPDDMPGFLEFAKTLALPVMYDLLVDAEPLTDPARYRYPRAVRRHFERLEQFPDGLVPIGDAVCHFNPVYGQGMSSAALQARALGGLLVRRARDGRGLRGLPLELFQIAHEQVRGPWALAAAADFQNPLCTGDFPMDELPSLQVLQQLIETSPTDDEARRLLADVMSLRRPLATLLEPELTTS